METIQKFSYAIFYSHISISRFIWILQVYGFITMKCYNAYDLGIIRALHTIWLIFIPQDYPNDDAKSRVRWPPCNRPDNHPLCSRMPYAPTLPKVPNVLQVQHLPKVQQMPHGSDTRRSIKKPLQLTYIGPEGTYPTAGVIQTDQKCKQWTGIHPNHTFCTY